MTGIGTLTPFRPLRLGMIGGGAAAVIGETHRRAARLDGQFTLVAGAFSASHASCTTFGRSLGLAPDRLYSTLEALIAGEAGRADGVEVVAIVTPNHLHAAAIIACLEAGLHVICDKPLARDPAEAEGIARVAAGRCARLFLTHNYAAYPMVAQAQRLIAAGEIGAIRHVSVAYLSGYLARRDPVADKAVAWRTDPARSGGGAIMDIGSHAWHLMLRVTGLEVGQLLARLTAAYPERAVDDHADVLIRFEGGATGHLVASRIAAGVANGLAITVHGETGTLTWQQEDPERLQMSWLDRPSQVIRRGGPGEDPAVAAQGRLPAGHPEGFLEAFANVYRDAALALRGEAGGLDSFATLAEGQRVLALIAACQHSAARDSAWVVP